MTNLSIALSMGAIFISIIAGIGAFFAWSTVIGLKNSTHKIQYIPVKDPEFNKFGPQDLKPQFDDDGNELPPDESVALLKAFKDTMYPDQED